MKRLVLLRIVMKVVGSGSRRVGPVQRVTSEAAVRSR